MKRIILISLFSCLVVGQTSCDWKSFNSGFVQSLAFGSVGAGIGGCLSFGIVDKVCAGSLIGAGTAAFKSAGMVARMYTSNDAYRVLANVQNDYDQYRMGNSQPQNDNRDFDKLIQQRAWEGVGGFCGALIVGAAATWVLMSSRA